VASVQAHEPGVTHNLARHQTSSAALEQRHPFTAARSDRLHHMSADPKLADERLRNLWECRRHENGVVRRCCRHAFGAVALHDMRIVTALGREVAPSLVRQVGPSFDTRHERCQPSEQGGLIAVSGTDLEYVLASG
jgi:hypothetical protein